MANRNIEGQLLVDLQTNMDKALSKRFADQVAKDIADFAIEDIIHRRIKRGVDNKGRNFDKYTDKYEKFKQRVIRGEHTTRTKRGKRRTNKRIRKLSSKAKGAFAARKVYDYMRLTGQLFRDMRAKANVKTYRRGRTTFDIRFRINGKRSQDVAKGLYDNGYKFYGLAKSGSTAQTEKRLIRQYIVQAYSSRLKSIDKLRVR